jgi:hypothetical protein
LLFIWHYLAAISTVTDAIMEHGAPATAVHPREVVLKVYRWAIELIAAYRQMESRTPGMNITLGRPALSRILCLESVMS